jgi:DNA-binding NtrC family response regulator
MNAERLNLLIVEDEEAHVEAIRRAFEGAGANVEIRAVSTLREFRAGVAERTPDLALIDLNLPDGCAMEVLTYPPETAPFPILVMTAFGTQEIVVEVIKAGALDYVVKSPEAFAAMPRTMERVFREWKLLQKHKQAETAIAVQLDELRRWHRATLGREGRVLEMKQEVNELLAKLGQPPRYPSAVEVAVTRDQCAVTTTDG